MVRKLSPYQRIARSAKRGTGLRLTAREVAVLSIDDAIIAVAEEDDEFGRLPKDEADHFYCFAPQEISHLMPMYHHPTCGGDGWYRCKECLNYKKVELDGG